MSPIALYAALSPCLCGSFLFHCFPCLWRMSSQCRMLGSVSSTALHGVQVHMRDLMKIRSPPCVILARLTDLSNNQNNRYCIRTKGKTAEIDKPGSCGKGQVYLEGAVDILREVDGINFHILYSGRVSDSLILLRGAIVNRTCGIHKKPIYLTIFTNNIWC